MNKNRNSLLKVATKTIKYTVRFILHIKVKYILIIALRVRGIF